MKRYVAGLMVALVVAGLWGSDGSVIAQGGCVSQGAVSPSETALAADCEVLLDIRDTLAGTATLDWAADVPIGEWEGISVGGTPLRVVVIHLSTRRLTGTIPTQLGNLSSLTELSLWGNQLNGAIPAQLGNLSSLTELDLSGNQLRGTIPSQLGSLSNLTELSLYGNQLNGAIPVQLGNLSKLTILWLDDNQLSGTIPSQLGSLSEMTDLNLGGNELTGIIPSQLGSLSNLTELGLSGNELSGSIPSQLGNLSELAWLDLSDNELSGEIPTQLGSLLELTWLDLSDNQLIGEIPSELGNLSYLETLYLGNNRLTGCIPAELRDVDMNDFVEVGLPFCAPLFPGDPTADVTATTTPMVRIGAPIRVTATFSEPVNGFSVDDIIVANGSAASFFGGDGDSVYTFDVIPNAVGEVTVQVGDGAAEDYEGYGNRSSAQLSLGIPYDDDHDGAISRDEVVMAIADYLFNGLLTRDQVVQIVALYLFG